MSEYYGERGQPITRGDYLKGEAKGRKYTTPTVLEKPYRYLLKVPIIMHKVSSTNVSAYGYDGSTQLLQVEYLPSGKKGYRMYRYFNVPREVWNAFTDAHSKGTFVWKFIRGVYAYQEVSAVTLWQTIARFFKRIMRS